MIKSQTTTPPKTHKYQIKYRLTGAAIIVGFAIVVISVMLKEPSIETNTRLTNNADSHNSGNQNASPSEDSTSGYDDNDAKPALLGSKIAVTPKQIPPTSKTTGAVKKEGKNKGESIVLTKDKPDATTRSAANSGSSQSPTNNAPVQPDESSKDISKNGSGWTVRVGTYAKIENVDKVSALLNSNGFKAQHAKVQTTLGAATRIWLGPYTKKKTAEEVSMRLKLITGEKGYVTETST